MISRSITPSERIETLTARLRDREEIRRLRSKVVTNMQRVGVLRLAQSIVEEHGTTFDLAMVLRSRHAADAIARYHFIAVVRWTLGLSYPEVASILDMDHSCAIYGTRVWEAILNGEQKAFKERSASDRTLRG